MTICIGCSKQCSYCLVNRLCNECNIAIDICNNEHTYFTPVLVHAYQSIWEQAALERILKLEKE